jgi:hypothetical protein
MLGQFSDEPDDELPFELVGGVLLVDPLVLAVVVEAALVAASATSTPPVIRPLVKAPMASTGRKWSFMVSPFCCAVLHVTPGG